MLMLCLQDVLLPPSNDDCRYKKNTIYWTANQYSLSWCVLINIDNDNINNVTSWN